MSQPATTTLQAARIRPDGSRLSDRVAIELGGRIVSGELGAGTRLPTEAELCSLYGVSRTVVRDAMRTLSACGLVDVRQGHGMIIAPPSDSPFTGALILYLMRSDLTVADLRDTRALLEPMLASLAAESSTPEDWGLMRGHLDRYAAAVKEKDWEAARSAHYEFHDSLLDSVHVPALSMLLRPVLQVVLLTADDAPDGRSTDGAAIWTKRDVSIHYPIIEALEARDAGLAAVRVREHIKPLTPNSTPFREFPAAQRLLIEILSSRALPFGEHSAA